MINNKIVSNIAGLFGLIVYAVHINGYATKDNQLMMWLSRRSNSRPTYLNMLDNMCAGGLTSGQSVRQCAIKECAEEASVPKKLTDKLKAVGCVSHIFEDKRGVFPVCEYVFDLHLPSNFRPVNADGEIGSFEMIAIEKIMDNIFLEDFRPSSAMIALDFLTRHGFVSPENEKNYAYLVEMMHIPLQSYFSYTTQLLRK
ncbi:LOW QUALITY PROTEIN: uncharacterized protein LOC127706636 [Mytilus californianus]|uniref:LOW QUALITY PROTEIN: uncharacterized protein LOC127706636 n=1 Tax=Mytilus californianus TaxID=6549 RepID=UPI00224829DC|nr:LOW QUALITY PROTEIN: uncharacterized protein LOC127706636 [Mytilus californianus]